MNNLNPNKQFELSTFGVKMICEAMLNTRKYICKNNNATLWYEEKDVTTRTLDWMIYRSAMYRFSFWSRGYMTRKAYYANLPVPPTGPNKSFRYYNDVVLQQLALLNSRQLPYIYRWNWSTPTVVDTFDIICSTCDISKRPLIIEFWREQLKRDGAEFKPGTSTGLHNPAFTNTYNIWIFHILNSFKKNPSHIGISHGIEHLLEDLYRENLSKFYEELNRIEQKCFR